MCGVAGALFCEEVAGLDINAVTQSIAHRGPDSSASWTDARTLLVHTRLAVLDLTSGGIQPKIAAAKDVVVTYNGEIYNHHALRRELERLGHHFNTRSDTEVLVEGYRRFGDGIVDRLDGMFAFAIWDIAKGRALLARDRAGKKPLYFARHKGALYFGSEIKALRALGVPCELDVDALPTLFSFGYNAAPRTMYRGIYQLPPAHLMTLEGPEQAVTQRRYWKAPFSAPPLDLTVDEATREVRRHVEAAVERRLEADVPLGAFLSGGIDSTIIVGVMAQKMSRRVKTFSIGFQGDARYDETHFARMAAERFDTEHTEFTLEPSSFDLVEKLVHLHDGPFGDSSAIPTYVVSQLTRKQVTVALTGDGGDELFCGYLRFLAAEAAERIPSALLATGAQLSAFLPGARGERTLAARARRFFDASALPLPDRLARLVSFFAFELGDLIHPDLRPRLKLDEPLSWMRSIVAATSGASTLSRILDHNFESYLPYDLLIKADRTSMAHGLETRSPFLDTALIELAARLPDSVRRRGRSTKWILKRAFEDLLPTEILHRGKMGFGVPLGTWFRGGLKDYLRDHFAPGARIYQYLNETYVQGLLTDHFEERSDHGHRVWLLLTFELWLRSLK